MKIVTLDPRNGTEVHDGPPTPKEISQGLVEAVVAYRGGKRSVIGCEPQTGGVEALSRAGFTFEAPVVEQPPADGPVVPALEPTPTAPVEPTEPA